jgi:hypothetical protein
MEMKAKELAAWMKEEDRSISDVAHVMMQEVEAIMKQRGVKTNAGCFAVLSEQERKWKAFAKLVPEASPDGFSNLIEHYMPDVHFWWKRG